MSDLVRDDYAYPLRIDPASGQAAQASYADHVSQMVRQLLLTTPGERVDLPQFGCGLRSLVFAPLGDALASAVQMRVLQALQAFLAGIVDVSEVSVLSAADSSAVAPGTILVSVNYTVVETQQPANTTLVLQ